MAAGKKTGGRAKGTLNKRTTVRKKAVVSAVESGESPLDFLLRVMRDGGHEYNVRVDAAKAAAPYVHPRLSTVDAKVTGQIDSTITFQTLYEAKP